MCYLANNKRLKVTLRRGVFFFTFATQLVVTTLLLATEPLFAQQLPVRHYNIEDGLPHSIVGAIHQDGRSYIWFGTAGGLSRFDGYHFTNYGKTDGLPSAVVTSITEDAKGELWIGTTGGIARLIDDPTELVVGQGNSPGARKKFVSYQIGTTDDSNAVNTILFDKSGALWCTSDEIYRAVPDANGKLKFEIAITHKGGWTTFRSFADSQGRLWFGLQRELIEVSQGEVIRYGTADGLPMEQSFSRDSPTMFNEQIVSITEDRKGRLVVANRRDVFEFVASGKSNEQRGHWRKRSFTLRLDREIRALGADTLGRLWIGTTKGLIRYSEDDQALDITTEGLDTSLIMSLSEDLQGNLWVGTANDGVYKSPGDFIVSFKRADGLPGQYIRSIVEGPQGTVYANTDNGAFEISGGKASLIIGSQPPSFTSLIRFLTRDTRGSYWVISTAALYRFNGPRLDFRQGKKFGPADGAPSNKEFGIGWYEDPAGRIWCGALNDPALYVLDTSESKPERFKRIPLEKTPKGRALNALHCAIDDGSGEIWFGWQADLGRYRDGRVELIEPPDGLSEILARYFLLDSRGWLWIGMQDTGVLMTKDPSAPHPQFVRYSVSVGEIVEDQFGRLYFSTPRGLDRLDPASGKMRNFTTADGLAGAGAGALCRDHQGNIWMGSGNFITKLNPRLERPVSPPPPVYFSRMQSAGEDLPLPVTGARQTQLFELPAARNNLFIEFVGLDFQGSLRYQYRLDGVDKDWSAPSEQRFLNYVRLTPGSYRLLVRTVNAEGLVNNDPSVMEFRILPPVWQRWWFMALGILAIATLLFVAYRYRIAHLMELERTRLRIARDLHDEVGSGLGSIGILSGLAAEDEVDETQRKALAGKIATASRELGNMLGEIVWALRQESETLETFAYHLTERAGRLFPSALPEFSTDFPAAWPNVKLSLPVRRSLQLIALEALHNAARHSQAQKVTLCLAPAGRRWQLIIADDGIGLRGDGGGSRLGMGLNNMQRRAAEVGAQIEVDSTVDEGTRVTVVFDPQAEEQT